MRQPRHGAALSWLLALLFPLLVAGGPGTGAATVLLRHPAVVSIAAPQHPLSHQVPAAERRHDLAAALTGTAAGGGSGSGGGGGHPVAAPPPDLPRHLLATGSGSGPAGGDVPRPLPTPPVGPARAPPSTGA
ncbi:hypothetical protein [Streptosporangium sp. NPDC051022]|uniref:hypothetical protein n=1 Tax=Streptosporangium sp. NPDC051022 TaxID=3155752 RepID=UPI003435B07F